MYKISGIQSRPSPFIPLEWPVWKLKASTIMVFAIEVIVLALHPVIFQDPEYHNFADSRSFIHVNNFWNVISNLGFLGVGIMALYNGFVRKNLALVKEITPAYIAFFFSVGSVAFGSAYYHLHPDNYTLLWDRLPMTITFMALLSIAFAEFMSAETGRKTLWPFLLLGLFSVLYWYYGELHNHGDLRMYAFVQMTPILLMPLFLVAGKRKFDRTWGYWTIFIFYLMAKIAERYDGEIYEFTFHAIGGHALKHLLVAIGLFFLIKGYEYRKPLLR